MSKLRASINFSFRKKELYENDMEFLDLNAKPIDDFTDLRQNLTEDDDENIGNENIGDENNIVTSKHWESELAEWELMLIEEEVSRLEEEEALRENPGSLRGDLLTEYKHPAIDTKAKWELKTLFSSVINIPSYLTLNEFI